MSRRWTQLAWLAEGHVTAMALLTQVTSVWTRNRPASDKGLAGPGVMRSSQQEVVSLTLALCSESWSHQLILSTAVGGHKEGSVEF